MRSLLGVQRTLRGFSALEGLGGVDARDGDTGRAEQLRAVHVESADRVGDGGLEAHGLGLEDLLRVRDRARVAGLDDLRVTGRVGCVVGLEDVESRGTADEAVTEAFGGACGVGADNPKASVT